MELCRARALLSDRRGAIALAIFGIVLLFAGVILYSSFDDGSITGFATKPCPQHACPGKKVCDATSGNCVQCIAGNTNNCPNNKPLCRADHKCVECTTDD